MSDLRLTLDVPTHLNPADLRVRMAGTWEQPWICLSDICAVIGIVNAQNVAARLRPTEKSSIRWADGTDGNPYFTFVSEAAFYKVLLRSDKPAAEPFVDWVTQEVLPSIRKHGCYPPPACSEPNLVPYTYRVLQAAQVDLTVPDGYWCVFSEAAAALIRAEQILIPAGLTLDADDLLDGSIGRRWSTYRRGKPWIGEPTRYDYRFPKPSRRSLTTVSPYAYPMAELPHFRTWLKGEYMPTHFPTYLRNKYGHDGFSAALPHIRRVTPAAITGA